MISAHQYDNSHVSIWNKFVCESKNGHFMFMREFMEYHSDLFTDCSIMFYDDKNRLVALLPANIHQDTLYSHQGLTFGGLVLSKKITAAQVLEVFNSLKQFSASKGLSKIIYKRIPDIYSIMPAQEDLYALFINDARLTRRDLNSTVALQSEYSYTKGRKWSINKAKKDNVTVREEDDLEPFWLILNEVLDKNHAAKSVHTLKEITLLKKNFPQNIKLFTASKNDELIAGALLFINKGVAHTQYMANTEVGRDCGALDYLINYLMKEEFKDKNYFNFGISTEQSGSVLNEGLVAQKEGFGARSTVHDFYEIAIK